MNATKRTDGYGSASMDPMRRTCFYHAGCPDGFGAAWAVWRVWGDAAAYVARGHDDPLQAREHEGDLVVFVDIAPDNASLLGLLGHAAQVVVLDHHVSSRARYERDPELAREVRAGGHLVRFDLEHSGAVLAWQHFHPGEPVPGLLRYVEDQDLWRWKLPRSEEVTAAVASHPRQFEAWDALASTSVEKLADEGIALVRANHTEVERALHQSHPVWLGKRRIEAVNAQHLRSWIGHELAKRASFGRAWGLVYRLLGDRVDASLYSIGDDDVSAVAAEWGGGGHRNAAGFSVPLERWLREFV